MMHQLLLLVGFPSIFSVDPRRLCKDEAKTDQTDWGAKIKSPRSPRKSQNRDTWQNVVE
jgi:hypothetical protein